MKNEQSLLLAVRHQMSALGYTESEINAQDSAIEHFAKLVVASIDLERRRTSCKPDTTGYKYYMHINDPNFSTWEHDALMCTFESESDWKNAVRNKDIDTCIAIHREVEIFCKTHRVPCAVFDFVKSTPANLATQNWKTLNECPYIVDAYCDEDSDEYVDGVTGEE
jgi:hypothetical protein